MLFYLAYKNIVSRKSSFVIILFIAFAISLMVLVNSIFDSTENGIENVYSKSFTGDIVIRPVAKMPLSLFGDETPVTGKLSEIPLLVPYVDIVNYVKNHSAVSGVTSQISGRAVVESEGSDKELEVLFGVESSEYFNIMTSIKVVDGSPYMPGERGVAISRQVAERYSVKIGDELQFLVEDRMTFRIRMAKVFCIYDYEIKNETLGSIILVDPFTMRSLFDMTDTSENVVIDENNQNLLVDDDFDSLFDDAEDFSAPELDGEGNFETVKNEAVLSEKAESSAWNFIIVQLKNRKEIKKTVSEMNRYFKKASWPVQAVTWRSAAGSTAMYLFWIRFVFNVGVVVVLCAGFIVINNTLVVNVLNRTQEIGTMRAEGASRKFVSVECMIETFMLTITAGILGCIIGSIASVFISSLDIHLSNSFLVQLFGSEVLGFSVSFMTVIKSIVLSVLLGVVGWIYPVHTALKVSPVKAMQGGN